MNYTVKQNRGLEVDREQLDAWTVHDQQDQEVYGGSTKEMCQWWIGDKIKEAQDSTVK